MYAALDILFVLLHNLVILFNLLGWAWRPTRRANLVLLLLTGLSWFGLGIFYGWGYCPITDWHYQVLENLGETDLPYSYISYLLMRLFGWQTDPLWVDAAVVAAFLGSLVISVTLNLRDYRQAAGPGKAERD